MDLELHDLQSEMVLKRIEVTVAMQKPIALQNAKRRDQAIDSCCLLYTSYSQFFVNNSRVYMPMMVAALRGIGCPVTAEITEKAIKAAGFHGLAIADLVAALDSYHQNYFRRNPPQFVAAAASDPEFLELVANADAPQLADDPKWDSRENELSECDHQYYRSGEDVAGKLFEFVRTHRGEFEL